MEKTLKDFGLDKEFAGVTKHTFMAELDKFNVLSNRQKQLIFSEIVAPMDPDKRRKWMQELKLHNNPPQLWWAWMVLTYANKKAHIKQLATAVS